MNHTEALKIAEGTFAQYGVDQPKWWRCIEGTPIISDMAARMATAFAEQHRRVEPVTVNGLLESYQELNMSNYGDEDVTRLNEWGIDAYTKILELTKTETRQEKPVDNKPKWQDIDPYTRRLQVPGGWIVKMYEDRYVKMHDDSHPEVGHEFQITAVFVADKNHNWTIEE